MTDQYIPDERFDALVAELASLDREDLQFENNIRLALGDVGGVWPHHCKIALDNHEAGEAAAMAGNPATGDNADFLLGHAEGVFHMAKILRSAQAA